MKKSIILTLLCGLCSATMTMAQEFKLTPSGYFRNHGVDVMAFDDIYPEGHQGEVCVIMHGNRIAINGDLRLEATPEQWQPVPRQLERKLDANSITTTLCYPDSSRHLTGFNPMLYPDLQLQYNVRVATSHRIFPPCTDVPYACEREISCLARHVPHGRCDIGYSR